MPLKDLEKRRAYQRKYSEVLRQTRPEHVREKCRLYRLSEKGKQTRKRHYDLNKERALANERLRVYGLTPEAYEQLLQKQHGRCAICKNLPEKRGQRENLDIDHCHATGVVRGLLCNWCNRGLGCFRDNPSMLKSAIAYLQSVASVIDVR